MDSRFIAELSVTANFNNIKVIEDPNTLLPHSDMVCAGYFSSNLMELKFNPNHPAALEVLVHESCHMDQFLENSDLWNKFISLPSFVGWVYHDFQLDMDEIENFRNITLMTEFDCELRSISKITNFNLNIDKELYAQKANAYLYALNLSFKYRKWIVNDPSLYSDLIEKMSKSLTLTFDLSLEENFKKCFF